MYLILLPLILSALTQSVLFKTEPNSFPKVHFQPPGYVFGVVWTLLYLLLGVYLHRLPTQERLLWTLFTANMLLNLAWMPVVNGYRKVTWGIFMIAAMLGLTGLMLVYDKNPSRKALLVPYMTWLLIAILLNVELSQITNVVARDW